MPDEIEEGHSPIDGLKTFDWGEAEDELREFIGDDDSENDSDASTASTSSRQSRASNKSSRRERKRKHDETSSEDDSDEESTLAKKQRIANSRTTGLKTVKTPNSMQSESSLPTPGVTGDEDGDDEVLDRIAAGDDDDGFGDDLEADLMAEFDREELEAQEAG
jgi:RNA polymerase II subunit A-like phosphatase